MDVILECADLSALWSAAVRRRFREQDEEFKAATGRSRPKALTCQRTPKSFLANLLYPRSIRFQRKKGFVRHCRFDVHVIVCVNDCARHSRA
jgi:hypothetical protein